MSRHSWAGFCALGISRTAFRVLARAETSFEALTVEWCISKLMWLLAGFRFQELLNQALQFPAGCRSCSVPAYRGLLILAAWFIRASKGDSMLVRMKLLPYETLAWKGRPTSFARAALLGQPTFRRRGLHRDVNTGVHRDHCRPSESLPSTGV